MSTNHRYQVMPPLSSEEYEGLRADIQKNGVKNPKDVDEDGNILDGFSRDRACKELGMDCPERVIRGLTDAEKREHAWRMNLTRRHLSKEQKREIARTLRQDGWTQGRIAQALGLKQRTVSRWLQQSSHSAKLSQPDTVLGKDGKRYPPKKEPRRPAQPTEGVNRPDNPFRADAEDRSTQGLEQTDARQPRGTHAEAQPPVTAPLGGSDAPVAPETLPQAADEPRSAAREQPSSAPESGPVASAEDEAEAQWVDALQVLHTKLETLHVQGGLLPPSTRWAPETRARGRATIQRMQETLIELAAVVGATMGGARDRNAHDVGATPYPVQSPITGEVQEHENGELVTVSSAEEPIGDVAESNQPLLQVDGEGKPPTAFSKPAQAVDRKGSPARPRTRRSKRASANGQGAGAPEQMAEDHTTSGDAQSHRELDTIGNPAPDHDEGASAPAVDAIRYIDVSARADHGDSVPGDRTRCGYCGATQFALISEESGKIFCKCESVYRPSTGRWHSRKEPLNGKDQQRLCRRPRHDAG
jgi:ParB-like chromosome segregation protein Spo0J